MGQVAQSFFNDIFCTIQLLDVKDTFCIQTPSPFGVDVNENRFLSPIISFSPHRFVCFIRQQSFSERCCISEENTVSKPPKKNPSIVFLFTMLYRRTLPMTYVVLLLRRIDNLLGLGRLSSYFDNIQVFRCPLFQ